MVKLSKRLAAAAALVSGGARLADVGTDHGYVPIYLIQQQKISGAIRNGPKEKDRCCGQRSISACMG